MNYGLLKVMASQVVSGVGVMKTVSGLKLKTFVDNATGQKLVAIEQNPKTSSIWAQKARDGAAVVQFKDVSTNKYVAVSVDGNITPYHAPPAGGARKSG